MLGFYKLFSHDFIYQLALLAKFSRIHFLKSSRSLNNPIEPFIISVNVQVYYSTENTREYHEVEEQWLEISEDLAPAVDHLIVSYPQWTKVQFICYDFHFFFSFIPPLLLFYHFFSKSYSLHLSFLLSILPCNSQLSCPPFLLSSTVLLFLPLVNVRCSRLRICQLKIWRLG